MKKKVSFQIFTLVVDIAILAASFLFWVWLKPASLRIYIPSHLSFFITLTILWFIISILSGKMHRGKIINLRTLLSRTLISNFLSLSIAMLLLYSLERFGYSRMIVLGTASVATVLELIFGAIYLAIKKAAIQDYLSLMEYETIKKLTEEELVGEAQTEEVSAEALKEVNEKIIIALKQECGQEIATGILNIARGKLNALSRIVSTRTSFNISALPEKEYSYLINLHKINDIKNLNIFLDTVNSKIKQGGYYLLCVETKDLRKRRLLKKYPPVLNYIFYLFDFFLKRVFPKLRITKWITIWLTRGNNVVISRAEALGRLARAGFTIEAEAFINNRLFIEGRKISEPLEVNGNNYGILITLPRIGRNGKSLMVYKMRTMHPYSEYIQEYVYSKYDLLKGGKFKHDFRITTWGAFARTIWLDELPMLINFVMGDMKMVGVRPLSEQYFNLYSKELQERRIKVKPGLIPPYYYDMPTSIEEIELSEMKYLNSHDKNPFRTDVKYFFVSIWNILIHRARSH